LAKLRLMGTARNAKTFREQLLNVERLSWLAPGRGNGCLGLDCADLRAGIWVWGILEFKMIVHEGIYVTTALVLELDVECWVASEPHAS